MNPTKNPASNPKIVLPYNPQDYQREIHNSPARYRVVCIGRRGGKTEFLINEVIRGAIKNPGTWWIVAPSYRQVKAIVWQRLKAILRVDPRWIYNEQELSAMHPIINTRIELRGADNEDSLRGVGLKGVGLDEAAMIRANVWPEIIRPMLADSKGKAIFISTPKGRNWFFDLFSQNGNDWARWQFPTTINKYIDRDEIEQMRLDMSERIFKQEVMAEFLDDETGVFRRVRTCVAGEFKDPVRGQFYVMGVDLAKSEDFTVLTVIDATTREVVAHERFNDIMWSEQKLRIQALARRYNNAMCFVDATGIGDPIVEDLQSAGVSVDPFKFTNTSKYDLISNLTLALEQRLITFPRVEVLIDELLQYEYSISDGGRIKYSAPVGKHDDCVISLALAVWGIRSQLRSAQVVKDTIEYQFESDKQGRGTPMFDNADDLEGAVSGY